VTNGNTPVEPLANRESASGAAGRSEKVLMAVLMVPFTAVGMAVAGALLAAMVFATISGGEGALNRALGVLILGVLVKAVLAGVIAAVIAGAVTFVFDRNSVFAGAAAGGFLVFLGFALWAIFLTALEASVLGCWIGTGVGAVLGVAAGLMVASDGKGVRPDAGRQAGSRGARLKELDWWRADFDDIGGDD
jgi:hypothetical protein